MGECGGLFEWPVARHKGRRTTGSERCIRGQALRLRSLLFEDPFRFLRGHPVLAIGPCNIAEGHGLRHGTELPKRTLSSLVRIRIEASTHQGPFVRHLRIVSVLRMVGHLQWSDLA